MYFHHTHTSARAHARTQHTQAKKLGVMSVNQWRRDPMGQHVELGIAGTRTHAHMRACATHITPTHNLSHTHKLSHTH